MSTLTLVPDLEVPPKKETPAETHARWKATARHYRQEAKRLERKALECELTARVYETHVPRHAKTS